MTLDDLVLGLQHLLDRLVRRARLGRAPEAGGRRAGHASAQVTLPARTPGLVAAVVLDCPAVHDDAIDDHDIGLRLFVDIRLDQ